MRTIAVVITARPSYSRVKSVLQAIKAHPDLELKVVVAASALLDRYGGAVSVIERDGFEIAARVFNQLDGDHPALMGKTTGLGLIELSSILVQLKPDIVVTVADRFETIATAIAAAYAGIPLAHIQGGEITGNIDEKVRHAVTKLADYHLVASEAAAGRVLRMGEPPGSVFVTGCPSIDLAREIEGATELGFSPLEKYGGVGKALNPDEGYLIVMQHPVTTAAGEARSQITETLHAVMDVGMPTYWFWPNIDAGSDETSGGIRAFREKYAPANIHWFKNMDPADFLRLLTFSRGIIGNSSVSMRECAYLGVPAVNIGDRQNRRDRGSNVIDAPYDRVAIAEAIRTHLTRRKYERDLMYGEGYAGQAIADVLASVTLNNVKSLAYD